jgi:hypothetical protein
MQRSLQVARRSGNAAFEFARSNPIPVALALGGLTWLLVSLSRRSTRG